MRLAAARAAKRFAVRTEGGQRRAGAGWRAVMLRWRRRTRVPTAMLRQRVSAQRVTSLITHYHLDFRFAFPSNSQTTRHVFSRSSAVQIWTTAHAELRSRSAVRRDPIVMNRVGSSAQRAVAAVYVSRQRHARRVAAVPMAARSLRHFARPLSRADRAGSANAAISSPSARDRVVNARAKEIRGAFLPLLHRSQFTRIARNDVVPATQRAPARQTHPDRTRPALSFQSRATELVWRTSYNQDSGFPQVAAAPDSTKSSSLPRSAFLSGAGVASPASPESIARASAPDSAFMDRVADDVIRRIRRHARIERERRGV